MKKVLFKIQKRVPKKRVTIKNSCGGQGCSTHYKVLPNGSTQEYEKQLSN